jgi:hypothetical protein
VDWADERFLEPVARLIDDNIQAAAESVERVQALVQDQGSGFVIPVRCVP